MLHDMIEEFNVDSKAEYTALSSTRSQKKKLKQTTLVPLWYSTGFKRSMISGAIYHFYTSVQNTHQ